MDERISLVKPDDDESRSFSSKSEVAGLLMFLSPICFRLLHKTLQPRIGLRPAAFRSIVAKPLLLLSSRCYANPHVRIILFVYLER